MINKTKENEILFIDARNIFTQVDRVLRKLSDEQIKNLSIITRLYENDSGSFHALIEEYEENRDHAETEKEKNTFNNKLIGC